MDIIYQYAKLRSNYGRQTMFTEFGPQVLDNITASPSEQKQFMLRNPVHAAIQHGPRWARCDVNTIRAEYASSGCRHDEGGWPRDVNPYDPELTQRYRRKVEKDDAYIHCIATTAGGMEQLVLQNNAVELYDMYFTALPKYPEVEQVSCRTVNEYRDGAGDSNASKRPISSICWRPDGGYKFAVTYVDVDFYRKPCQPITCSIWDTENANQPETVVEPPVPLLDLQYNPRDINLLAGGLMNGQVALWDVRQARSEPSGTCPPHVAHRDLVRNVRFINSKNGMEFFSGGPDGVCKWWDLRNMSEPTDEMIIDVVPNNNVKQSMATASGISCLEFEPTIPTRFMVGTENGLVITGNRKGKTAVDKLPAQWSAHLGPVVKVERNPGFLKNFLTVGDWTARVWSEETRESCILTTQPQRHRLTHGAWSPSRLSLLMLTQGGGRVALWDLLRRQNRPVLALRLCDEPLLRVVPHYNGKLVACGSARGSIYLLELSNSLVYSGKHDKQLMTAMLERETKRERILESRLREIRLKRAADEASAPPALSDAALATLGDRDLQDAAAEYFQITKKELSML